MMFGKDGASRSDLQLRVTTAESVSTYRVDRWD
jgi:hypothetical protein